MEGVMNERMNHIEELKLALEAGFWQEHTNTFMCTSEDIKAFEAFVRADEREQCAKFFDLNDTNLFWGSQAARYIRENK